MDAEDAFPRPKVAQRAGASASSAQAAGPLRARRWLQGLGLLLVLVGLAMVIVDRRFSRHFGGASLCGNGHLDGDEECDDGNEVAEDGCLPTCRLATCGDGVKRAFAEECDDGNRAEGDGCSSGCLLCASNPGSFSSPSNGHCYWREPEARSFTDAAAKCGAQNGYLATFASDAEWREVTERLVARGGPGDAWVGLRQEEINGVRDFAWIGGERLLTSHWSMHEPRRAPGHDCVVLAGTGTWSAAPCNDAHPYVCERPRWQRAPHDARAYRRFVDRQTWDEAAATCAKHGARLVSFRSLADQERISRRYQGPIWIGARSDDKTGEFVWVSGEPMSFRDFAPGEPNLLAAQHCVALDIDGRWYNRECSDRNRFVCEVL